MELRLLSREMLFRWGNSLLILVALLAAATIMMAAPTTLSDYNRQASLQLDQRQQELDEQLNQIHKQTDAQLAQIQEAADQRLAQLDKKTKRVMRDLGFNLRIVHRDTALTGLLADYEALPIPEQHVTRLAESPEITKIVHIVATIKRMVKIDDQPRLIIGYSPEATQSHLEKKPPMGFQIEKGTVYLGNLAGKGKSVGDTIDVLGSQFKIANILPLHGSRDRDILIGMHLEDAQQILDMPGQITEIIALGCKCKTVERIEEIRDQLEAVLPDTQVFELRTQAIARDEQRKLVTQHYRQQMDDLEKQRQDMIAQVTSAQTAIIEKEKQHHSKVTGFLRLTSQTLAPVVLIVVMIWVGCVVWMNAVSRQEEFGILRAIGKSSSVVLTLLIGKATILGLLAGTLGAITGLLIAQYIGGVLTDRIEAFNWSWGWLFLSLLVTPLVAVLASLVPSIWIANRDPSQILSGE